MTKYGLQIPVLALLFLLFLLSNDFLYAQNFGGLIHFPPDRGIEGNGLSVSAELSSPIQSPERVMIYFRQKGATQYEYEEMRHETDSYRGVIPSEKVIAPEIEYFIVAAFAGEKMLTSPAANPMSEPHVVPIIEQPGSQQGEPQPSEMTLKSGSGSIAKVIILSPEPGVVVQKEEIVIAMSLSEIKGNIDVNSVKIYLDKKDVTAKSQISPFLISYVPRNISGGRHSIKITFVDSQKRSFPPVKWNFEVNDKNGSNFSPSKYINGNIYFDVRAENISDSSLSSVNAGARLSGRTGGIHYRSSLFLTSYENPNHQPRNRYLLKFGTRWLGIRLGDTNPAMNDLMLWGSRVRGIEGDLKLGFFNLKIVHGETQRAVEGALISSYHDPVTNDTLRTNRYGTYRQKLCAIRPSFGSGRNFQLGFNYLKVKDDIRSVDVGTRPRDNIVLGSDVLFSLFRRRLVIKAGIALSVLTQDISPGAITKSQIDSVFETDIPVDPKDFENLIVINTSTVPLDPGDLSSLAYNAEVKLRLLENTLRFQYHSIGSEYVSLGNTFLRNNIRGFSLSDRIRLLQNQLYLTVGFEHLFDGLDLLRDGNLHTKPIELKAINFGINYYPHTFGLPTVSLNIKEKNRANGLDTLNAIGDQNQDVGIQLGYELPIGSTNNSVQLSYIGSDRNDDFNSLAANVASDIRMLTVRTKYQFPLVTTFSISYNGSATGKDSSKISFDYNQLGFSADYFMLQNKLRLTSGIFITSGMGKHPANNEIVEYIDYRRTAFNFGGTYKLSAKQSLMLNAFFVRFEDEYSSKYNESIIRIRYEYRY